MELRPFVRLKLNLRLKRRTRIQHRSDVSGKRLHLARAIQKRVQRRFARNAARRVDQMHQLRKRVALHSHSPPESQRPTPRAIAFYKHLPKRGMRALILNAVERNRRLVQDFYPHAPFAVVPNLRNQEKCAVLRRNARAHRAGDRTDSCFQASPRPAQKAPDAGSRIHRLPPCAAAFRPVFRKIPSQIEYPTDRRGDSESFRPRKRSQARRRPRLDARPFAVRSAWERAIRRAPPAHNPARRARATALFFSFFGTFSSSSGSIARTRGSFSNVLSKTPPVSAFAIAHSAMP